MVRNRLTRCVFAAFGVLFVIGTLGLQDAWGEVFKIGISQSQANAARKYRPLEEYLKGKGIEVQFLAAKDYPAAASMFTKGEIDAMFAGSGLAGTMIIKGLASPVLRPVKKNGHSSYWAVVVAPKGSPRFDGKAEYFRGKKVLLSPLASAGEYFFRAIPGIGKVGANMLYAANHEAAVDALAKGAADVAVVKNWTWESAKGKYPALEKVGEDTGENPDGTLIVSRKANKAQAERVTAALFALNSDQGPAAEKVRQELDMNSFIPTTEKDFSHNVGLLRRAGVDASFNFSFK